MTDNVCETVGQVTDIWTSSLVDVCIPHWYRLSMIRWSWLSRGLIKLIFSHHTTVLRTFMGSLFRLMELIERAIHVQHVEHRSSDLACSSRLEPRSTLIRERRDKCQQVPIVPLTSRVTWTTLIGSDDNFMKGFPGNQVERHWMPECGSRPHQRKFRGRNFRVADFSNVREIVSQRNS